MALRKKLLAEFLGTTLLLACVVGSGIMGVNISQGNDAIALLANAGATAGVLYVLIAVLGPISGAHFNPAVTLVMRLRGELRTRDAIAYIGVQVLAAIAGVMLAHAMFDLPLLQPGTHARTGQAQWLSEAVATFGLVLTILLGIRHRPTAIPALVALSLAKSASSAVVLTDASSPKWRGVASTRQPHWQRLAKPPSMLPMVRLTLLPTTGKAI